MRRVLAILLLVFGLAPGCRAADPATPGATAVRLPPGAVADPDLLPIEVVGIPADFPRQGIRPNQAFEQRARDTWVIGAGTVERILRDDTKRPRHQRFVLQSDGGPTLLLAHNIDLAPRVPLRRGDRIAFRGQYAWNDQGGVVHWTHRDRRDRKAGGWIRWKGQNFR
jgi:hypothetical protein